MGDGQASRAVILAIDLVPQSLWERSLYRRLPRYRWQKLRAEILKRDGQRCSVCGSAEKPFVCDEVWEYENAARVAHLRRLRIICRMCSFVKHLGHTSILAAEGRIDLEDVVAHFLRVNGCDRPAYEEHHERAVDEWRERNKAGTWTVDLGPYAHLVPAPEQS